VNIRFAADGSLRPASCCAVLIVALLWTGGVCKKAPLPDAYVKLRSVQSPDQVVFSRMPPQYTVPITLSGDIADEMEKTLHAINLESPHYQEVLDKSHQFHLLLANQNYSLETRDLLSGVLNPAEMIDIVISSVLKYRQEESFREIAEQTTIACNPGRLGSRAIVRFELVPKGKYFAYDYEDMGSYVRESWLTRLVCVMDSATRAVYELTLHKNSRTFAADQTQKPPVDSSVLSYAFTYAAFEGVVLPAGLALAVNGTRSLTLEATYRWEGQYMVFDTRKICYVNPRKPAGEPTCLMMTYGAYQVNSVPASLKQTLNPDHYAQNLEKAARLSRMAVDRLRNGKIDDAIQTLKKLAADFPETPQAVEARKLLDGLPGAAAR
jgi:hypothetical protein